MAIVKDIFKKFISITAIAAVVMLNFSAVIHCKSMVSGDGCCHSKEIITEKISPCCVKHFNFTNGERITGSCGCSMHETPSNVDLYNDLFVNYSRTNLQQTDIIIESAEYTAYTFSFAGSYYSPPSISDNKVFLANMNLRI